jgi:hypothetical protein
MLHFLISKPDQKAVPREVTVVCDQWDVPMKQLLAELAAQLHALPKETNQ